MGALAAAPAGGVLGSEVFWGGYLCLFSMEVATVLINDVVDLESDRSNRFFSTFTGGSWVLVEGLLSPREVRAGIGMALGVVVLDSSWLLALSPARRAWRAGRHDGSGLGLHGAAPQAVLPGAGGTGCGADLQHWRAAAAGHPAFDHSFGHSRHASPTRTWTSERWRCASDSAAR